MSPAAVPKGPGAGLWLGLLGVAVFALTLPVTRLAVGTPDAPQLSGSFVASARAAFAGLASLAWLLLERARPPRRADWTSLLAVTAGVVLGFPLLTSIAMRHVDAVHASVLTGVLPLATAVVGALLQRQRPSLRFWLCAALGSALVVAYALLTGSGAGLRVAPADLLLLLACGCAAVGYAFGARLSQTMRAELVICWALVLALPLSLPALLLGWPAQPVAAGAWWSLGYLALFSQWLGFFAWYRALALGGTVRVSQLQLLQPFLGMLFSVPLLGETIDAAALLFGAAVIATVFLGRRQPVAAGPMPIREEEGVLR